MPFYVKLGSAYLNQEGTFTNRSLTTEGTKPFDTEEEALAAGVAAGAANRPASSPTSAPAACGQAEEQACLALSMPR